MYHLFIPLQCCCTRPIIVGRSHHSHREATVLAPSFTTGPAENTRSVTGVVKNYPSPWIAVDPLDRSHNESRQYSTLLRRVVAVYFLDRNCITSEELSKEIVYRRRHHHHRHQTSNRYRRLSWLVASLTSSQPRCRLTEALSLSTSFSFGQQYGHTLGPPAPR